MNDKKKSVTEAQGILRRLESLMLITQDSAEDTDLDPSIYADALDVMRGMVRKVEKILENLDCQQV